MTTAENMPYGKARAEQYMREHLPNPTHSIPVPPLAEEFLTVDQVAELLHTTRPRVWQMRCRGQLPPAMKIGRSVLWDRAEFHAWLNSKKEK